APVLPAVESGSAHVDAEQDEGPESGETQLQWAVTQHQFLRLLSDAAVHERVEPEYRHDQGTDTRYGQHLGEAGGSGPRPQEGGGDQGARGRDPQPGGETGRVVREGGAGASGSGGAELRFPFPRHDEKRPQGDDGEEPAGDGDTGGGPS